MLSDCIMDYASVVTLQVLDLAAKNRTPTSWGCIVLLTTTTTYSTTISPSRHSFLDPVTWRLIRSTSSSSFLLIGQFQSQLRSSGMKRLSVAASRPGHPPTLPPVGCRGCSTFGWTSCFAEFCNHLVVRSVLTNDCSSILQMLAARLPYLTHQTSGKVSSTGWEYTPMTYWISITTPRYM